MCNARTLLGGSFRDFAARLADSPLLQWFCRVASLIGYTSSIPADILMPPINSSSASNERAAVGRVLVSNSLSYTLPVGISKVEGSAALARVVIPGPHAVRRGSGYSNASCAKPIYLHLHRVNLFY
jgi:hypothetical protein